MYTYSMHRNNTQTASWYYPETYILEILEKINLSLGVTWFTTLPLFSGFSHTPYPIPSRSHSNRNVFHQPQITLQSLKNGHKSTGEQRENHPDDFSPVKPQIHPLNCAALLWKD